ncbi:ribonuclease H-like domain-containing protein [Tanacetum coccineum]
MSQPANDVFSQHLSDDEASFHEDASKNVLTLLLLIQTIFQERGDVPIDDLDIEEMDINWQIAMIAIRMKKFYKKTGRRVRIDGNKPVGFDKKKLECFKCHNTGHFARECTSKGTNDGKKRDSFYQDQGDGKKERNQSVCDSPLERVLLIGRIYIVELK